MTKKRVLPVKKYETATFQVQDTLLKTQASCMPTNLAEEKEKFLKNGKTPKFHIKDRSKVEQLALKTKNNIRFELFGEAQYILEKVRDTYGNGEYYLEHAFGPRITKEEATPILLKYIAENNVPESLKINWCENLTCSAKMVWSGPNVNSNRPELRKYSLWLNGSDENPYMRESGIRCLMDHEIGTHFYRSFNDGLQPWYADRERFGLRKLGTFEGQCTEEGLAAIHTVLRGRIRYLWGAAMGYYIACKSAEMTFKELFDHLGRFTTNPDYRWKQAMRVKRGLPNPNDLGGFGNDQCYFEGAVNILRRMDDIDFQLMMMGKVCYDELDRIKRVVRKDVVQYPSFIKNINAYRKSLRKMLALNGLEGLHPQRGPPVVYVKHLEEKKRGKTNHKGKKVRCKPSFLPKKLNSRDKGKVRSVSSNKKDDGDDDDDNDLGDQEDEELKSFSCSYPFINMHLRGKSVSEIEKFLQSEPEGLRDVKELTGSILLKDNLLDKQLQKLQDIVKNHQWSKKDDCDVKTEEVSPMKDEILLPVDKDSEPLSDGLRCLEICNDDNLLVKETEASASLKESDVINETIHCDMENCPETVTYTLCPSGEDSRDSTPIGQFKSEDSEPICLQSTNTNNSCAETKKGNNIEQKKSKSHSRSHQVETQRSKQDAPTSAMRRKVLQTPVAHLSCYDDIFEQNQVTSETNWGDIPNGQKRVSLKSQKTSETDLSDGDRINEFPSPSQPLSTPPPPVNSFENLCRDRLFHYSVHFSQQYKNDISLSKPCPKTKESSNRSVLCPPIQNDSIVQKNNSCSVVPFRRRAGCHSRPLSSGSERILKLHWMNVQTSTAVLHRKPLQPNATALLNVNNRNNSLAPIKHTTSSLNASLLNNTFQ